MSIVFGIVGLILISIAIWVTKETRQNYLFILGGSLLLFYSIAKEDWVFIVLQIVFIFSAIIELIKRK